MILFKSIKWRLQIWHSLILVVVLAGFGFTAYQLEWGRQMRQIDDELHRRVGVIVTALHPPPPHGSDFGGQPFGSPPLDRLSDDGPSGRDSGAPAKFHLPLQAAGLFDTNDPNNFYFVIQSRDGKEIAHSASAPNKTFLTESNFLNSVNTPLELHQPPEPVTIKNSREIFLILPGEQIWVGCSIEPKSKALHLTALKLAGIGGVILLLGLAGGWRLVRRAIRPIDDISAAAVKISAGDLSQRINVAETESELGKLATILNSTFARLESAFAQQRQFTSDAAHELRTPVSVILTQTQTALNREREAADYKQTVEACQRAAQRMRKLISALLELARLDAGQEVLKRLRFDFSKTVVDCVELVKPLAEERGVKIVTELSPLEITGDSERLSQVATNLLTNAIQYNKPKGEVRVKLALQNGLAILTVSDSSSGISREDLPHVFQRFYRGDKSRTGGSNTGLGLAISKAIVEAHGGTIEVASEENTGTTLTVILPRAATMG